MKTAKDPRHLKRINLMQSLYTRSFQSNKKPTKAILHIISKLDEIDDLISRSAPDRPLKEINRIDLAILRLSIFELIIKKGVPFKVAVDEAVELGKEFGSNSSASFINGVLGQIIAKQHLDE